MDGSLVALREPVGGGGHKIRLTASVEVTVSLTSPWWGVHSPSLSTTCLPHIQETNNDYFGHFWQEMYVKGGGGGEVHIHLCFPPYQPLNICDGS